jgi:hypothetical protein
LNPGTLVVGPVVSAAGLLIYFSDASQSVSGLYGAASDENLVAISPLAGHDWSDPVTFDALVYDSHSLADFGLPFGPIPLVTSSQSIPTRALPNPNAFLSRTVSSSALGSWEPADIPVQIFQLRISAPSSRPNPGGG